MPSLLTRALEEKQERARILTEARANLDKETRTDEDNAEYDRFMTEVTTRGANAERFERQHNLELEGETAAGATLPPAAEAAGTTEGLFQYRTEVRETPSFVPAVRDYELRADSCQPYEYARTTDAYRTGFRSMLGRTTIEERATPEEARSLAAGAGPEGGYTVAPVQFMADLIRALDNAVFIRSLARVIQVPGAHSLGVPSLDNDPADADWTSELLIGDEDSTMDFGHRELVPHPLAKYIKVSKKLLRASALGIEALVMERLAYKFAVSEEKAFLTGSGASQPLGVFTASDLGVSTGRDVSSGNTTTSIQFDGLMGAKYGLKQGYWQNARWMFHSDGVLQIAKLKDGEGQYLWRESVRAGEPDILLGRPIMASEYAPNTFTTGLYVGMLADWGYYWIADALDMTIQVLVELFAATNQNGYIGRLECDGMPVLEEAFSRVKLA